MQFRIKDTRFRVVPARDGKHLLYRGEAAGATDIGGWTFLGCFDSESECKARARIAARRRSLHSRTPGLEARELLTGALKHDLTRVRMAQ